MTAIGVVPVLVALAAPAAAPSGSPAATAARRAVESEGRITFAPKTGAMSLLGVGLRTRTFLKLKVYALGLYVSDSALAGPLAVHKGKVGTPAFYRDLVQGDFEKQLVLRLLRDLSAEQIRGSFRSHMTTADRRLLEQFVSYFPADTEAGQECVLHWVPGGRLDTKVAGVDKPPIRDKAFADALFAIWLRGRHPEDPLAREIVSRAAELLKRPDAGMAANDHPAN